MKQEGIAFFLTGTLVAVGFLIERKPNGQIELQKPSCLTEQSLELSQVHQNRSLPIQVEASFKPYAWYQKRTRIRHAQGKLVLVPLGWDYISLFTVKSECKGR